MHRSRGEERRLERGEGGSAGEALFDRAGNQLGKARARLAGNGSAQFLGLIAHVPDGGPAAVIFRARFVNGNSWPAVDDGEGVVLDDLELSTPRAP